MPVILHTGGGGAPLNYAVKAYASLDDLPTAGKENELAVVTSAPIANVFFQTAEPSAPTAGDVWIPTRNASPQAFNVLKKGALLVYPSSSVKQYVNSAWVACESRLWSGSAWETLNLIFFNGGDNTSLTGGWNPVSASVNTYIEDVMFLQAAVSNTAGYLFTNNTIQLSGVQTIRVYVDSGTPSPGAGSNSAFYFYVCPLSTAVTGYIVRKQLLIGENTVDVSSVGDGYYLAVSAFRQNAFGSCTISAIWEV